MLDCTVTARGFEMHIKTKEGQNYVLTAQRKQDVDDWVSAIKDACNAATGGTWGGASPRKTMAPGMLAALGSGGTIRSPGGKSGKRGWAVKKGKKRYLILRPGELVYFDKEVTGDSPAEKPKGVIRLASASTNEVSSTCFLVRSEGMTQGWVFELSTASEASAWLTAIAQAIMDARVQLESGLSMSGWMVKKGKRRWFALKKGVLYWYNEVQPVESVNEQTANGCLSLKRCRVAQIEGQRFGIVVTPHQDTGEKPVEFSCYTDAEMKEWMDALKAGQAEHSQSTFVDPFASSGNGLVFGRRIEEVLAREGTTVPNIVTCCCEFLRLTALESPGIFRLSGSSNNINRLRDIFDAGEVVDFAHQEECELDSIAGVLKLYVRQLPEPPLMFANYQAFLEASDNPTAIRDLILKLPKPYYDFVVYLCHFLADIVALSDRNQMTPSNMAIVMGPNLLRPREEDLMSGLKDTPKVLNLTKTILSNMETVFPDGA